MEEPAGVEACANLAERVLIDLLWGLRTDAWSDPQTGHIQSAAPLQEWYPSWGERGWEIQLWLHMGSVQLAEGEVDE